MVDAPKVSVCSLCNLTLPSRSRLFVHLREAHPENGNQPVKSIDTAVDLHHLTIAYEDDHCRVIVKPQGLSTMGHKGLTVFSHPDLRIVDGSQKRCAPCHRLDKDTGGLLICSKKRRAKTMIAQCFKFKWINKRYIAIVLGKLEPESGEFTSAIKGKASRTKYHVTSYDRSHGCGWISTVELWPLTGRRHQLRKHLSQAGHPILGDKRYSHAATWPKESNVMFLWAVELSIPHPDHLQGLFDRFHLYGAQVLGEQRAVQVGNDENAAQPAGSEEGDEEEEGNDGDDDDEEEDDEEDEEEEEEGEGGVSDAVEGSGEESPQAKRRRRSRPAEAAAEITAAMQLLPRLHISIPEPEVYAAMRQARSAAFQQQQQESAP